MSNYLGFKDIDEAIASTSKTSQVEAVARIMTGDSVFLSGVAGAGKSFVINHVVEQMKEYFLNAGLEKSKLKDVIAVTGSTGLAAVNLNGTTIHSYSGLGICEVDITEDPKKCFDKDFRDANKISYGFLHAYRKLKNVRIIVIDEISMLSALFLDNLDSILKMAKRSNEPFGGVSMVFVGDFMQLPPVAKKDQHEKSHQFAFEANSWKELNPKVLFMDKPKRSADSRLNTILKDMRESTLSEETKEYLKMCKNNELKDSYVRLFMRNMDVDDYNRKKLAEINLPEEIFTASVRKRIFNHKNSPNLKDFDKMEKDQYKNQFKQLGLPEDGITRLKVGAVVLVTQNFSDGVRDEFKAVNGDTGVVVSKTSLGVKIKLNRTGEVVNIDYVTRLIPVGVPYKVTQDLETKTVKDFVEVTYLPVKLSFATTIHKSQGQTLHGVVVDLKNCFSPGLGYVAMSRVASLDNLVITGIDRSAFRSFAKCSEFSKKIEEEAEKNSIDFAERKREYVTILENTDMLNIFWGDVTLDSPTKFDNPPF